MTYCGSRNVTKWREIFWVEENAVELDSGILKEEDSSGRSAVQDISAGAP